MPLFQKPEEQKPFEIPEPSGTIFDTLPKTEMPVERNKQLFREAKDFGISILRSIPRSAVSVSLSLFGRDKLDPETKVEKVMLGQEPIGNLHNEGAKTLKMFGANEENQQKYGTILGMGLAMADLIPGIPGKKQVVKEVVEEVMGKVGKEVLQAGEPILKGQSKENIKRYISNKNSLEGLSVSEKKEEFQSFMGDWSVTGPDKPTKDMYSYVESLNLKPLEPITLYRGVNPGESHNHLTRFTSWTRDLEIAQEYGSKVITKTFKPQEIWVDFEKMAESDFSMFDIMDESEVIVKPFNAMKAEGTKLSAEQLAKKVSFKERESQFNEVANNIEKYFSGKELEQIKKTETNIIESVDRVNNFGDKYKHLSPEARQELYGKFIKIKDDAFFAYNKLIREKSDKLFKASLEGKSKSILSKTTPETKSIFKGYDDITTKFLDYSKGKTTLSRQEILDFAKRPELKKGEADLLNRLGQEVKEAKVPAQEFADSIRRDLLELTPVKVKDPQYQGTTIRQIEPGNIRSSTYGGKNYEEVVFESPIITNGSSHFPNSKNYFAHARGDEVVENGKKIWREQEIQSDLLQKEGLERLSQADIMEANNPKITKYLKDNYGDKFWEVKREFQSVKGIRDFIEKNNPKLYKEVFKVKEKRLNEINKLSSFANDRYGERILRERIKAKAQAGYESYRLPTGETIGKIEGFQETSWSLNRGEGKPGKELFPEDFKDLKVGDIVNNSADNLDYQQNWIITDILGDGRFKAVPKKNWDYVEGEWGVETAKGKEELGSISETFDLTGKSNPQYRRYENWGKFLKNKYGGKEIIDPQGNKWMEIDIKPEYKTKAIEAFGIGAIGTGSIFSKKKEEKQNEQGRILK